MARHRGGYARAFRLAALTSTVLLGPALTSAEVATDGTLGARVRLTGRQVEVPARLGQVRGQNLFHSFQRFSIETGNRVTFTGPGGLENVVGRVTGGERSEIDGTLASSIPGADLWLLNPAGLLFGPNAQLDLPAAFHASTADELRFADGAVFSALDPEGSTLSVAAPEAFGFLEARPPGPITVDQSVLEVEDGEALSLVGGDVTITGDDDGIANNNGFADEPGTVRARAGRVTLTALGGPGTVAVATGKATGAVTGAVRLGGEAAVVASGEGGGAVQIQGGRIVVSDHSRVYADNWGSTAAVGGVEVAAGTLEVSQESLLTADTFGSGRAGMVWIRADALELRSGSEITSFSFGPGDAGEVAVTAGRVLIDGRGSEFPTVIGTPAGAGGSGGAGRVTIEANTLELRGDGRISSDTFGPGDAGSIVVNADTLKLREGGRITSDTFGPGNAGSITVTAGHLLVVGIPLISATGIFSNANGDATDAGDAGTVTVQADTLELRDGGWIGASTSGPGAGGRVTVEAGTLELRGGYITSDTNGSGDAGAVAVVAGALTVRGAGSRISSNGQEAASGAAGDVSVRASRLAVQDGGLIGSSGLGSGPAGDVRLDIGTLEVADASIRTEGAGAAGGRITITASDLIHLHDAEVTASGVEPGETSSVITLAAPLIALDDSRVTALTGAGEPLAGSGLARLLGGVTVISSDSFVAASSGVTLTGLEDEVGSRLAVPEGVFLGAGDLLREPCAARGRAGAEVPSSFTAAGRGGLPPDPAGPLAAPYRKPDGAGHSSAAAEEEQLPGVGPVLRVAAAAGCNPHPDR